MSGGNKRRRKKCRWNICHLGINVVQSVEVCRGIKSISQLSQFTLDLYISSLVL